MVLEFIVPVQLGLTDAERQDLEGQALSWGSVGEPVFGDVVDAKLVKSGVLMRVKVRGEGEGELIANELLRLMKIRLVVGGKESIALTAQPLRKTPNLNVEPGQPIPAFWDED